MNKRRILFVSRGVIFDILNDVHINKYGMFSNDFDGDIAKIVVKRKDKHFNLGQFGFKGCYVPQYLLLFRPLVNIYFFIWLLTSLIRNKKNKQYEAIISCDALSSGLICSALSSILKIPLITEFNGNYSSPYIWNAKNIIHQFKRKMVNVIVPYVVRRSSAVRLLYPGQLDGYKNIVNTKKYVFHEYVPIEGFEFSKINKPYIAFLGGPLYLKGVDVLLDAFNQISSQYPDIELRIYGWSPIIEYASVKRLANKKANIHFLRPVPYKEANKVISECLFLVLPSRTEAMGRVLIEAMAYGKAILGSKVDGIPHYIRDRENGLTFESENVEELKSALIELIENKALRESYGENGRDYAMKTYTQSMYYLNYKNMINDVVDQYNDLSVTNDG